MERYQIGLLTTFLLGIFIIIGALLALLVSKKDKITEISIGLAFGVIISLIITDLIPEIYENFGISKIYLMIIFGVIGFLLLKVLDIFIPDHHEEKMSKKEENENMVHIGIITSLALVLHNIIEGMAIYSSCLNDASLGVILTLGVGCHNIPLGMVIASSFYHSTKNIKKTFIAIILVSLSTFIGGILMFMFNLTVISNLILGILLSITLGMLIFISLDELFPRICSIKRKKNVYIGITIGIILLIISMFF